MPPPELFSESPDGKPCNLITRENYEDLRDSFFRYASLMKKEAVHAPGLTMAEGITRLHDEMSDLVGNDMNVNIEQDGERLIFRLWKCHRWGELTLYYFPVKFVENLGPELRRISVTFIHNLMQANGIDTILDEDDTEYALTWLAEENDDEQDDRKKRLKLLHSYEKGRIHSLLRRVERKSYYKDLPKAIGRYKPARFFVTEIIREKILLYYDKEIPYSVEVMVEQFKEEAKKIHISAVIYVERDSQKGIIIGKQGKALKKVATEARRDLERFFGKTIFLETFVKVDKDWRSSDKELRNFGYQLD